MTRPARKAGLGIFRIFAISGIYGFFVFAPSPALASPWLACIDAIKQVAAEEEIPEPVLLAIAQQESGVRRGEYLIPWPYVIQEGKKSYYFNTISEAELYATYLLQQEKLNFDSGCMQINWLNHKDKIPSPKILFDPLFNVRFGAKYLKMFYIQSGSWAESVGKYHNKKREIHHKYQCDVASKLVPRTILDDC